MTTPVYGSTINFTNVCNVFSLTKNPPSRSMGTNFRFSSYNPFYPNIPSASSSFISLSYNLGGKSPGTAPAPPTLAYITGTPQWISTITGPTGTSDLTYISVEPNNNVYMTVTVSANVRGNVYDVVTSSNVSAPFTAVNTSGALIKYNSNGSPLFIALMTNNSTANQFGATKVVYDINKNIYLSVYSSGNFTTGTNWITAYDAGSSTTGKIISPLYGVRGSFICKYNSSGIAQYVLAVTGPTGFNQGPGGNSIFVDTDNTGAIYGVVIASIGSSLYYIWGPDGSNLFITCGPINTGNCMLLMKWDPTGIPLWGAFVTTSSTISNLGIAWNEKASLIGVTVRSGGNAPVIALNAGEITGGLNSTVNSDSSTTIGFVTYNPIGVAQWIAIIKNTDSTRAWMSADSLGNWYIAFTSASGLAPIAYSAGSTSSVTAVPTPNLRGCCLAKYSSTGALQWIATMDGTGDNYASSVKTDGYSNVYVCVQTGPNAAINAYNQGSSTTYITSLLNYVSSVWVKYDSNGTALSTAIISSRFANAGINRDWGVDISSDSLYSTYSNGATTSVSATGTDGTTVVNTIPRFGTAALVRWT